MAIDHMPDITVVDMDTTGEIKSIQQIIKNSYHFSSPKLFISHIWHCTNSFQKYHTKTSIEKSNIKPIKMFGFIKS